MVNFDFDQHLQPEAVVEQHDLEADEERDDAAEADEEDEPSGPGTEDDDDDALDVEEPVSAQDDTRHAHSRAGEPPSVAVRPFLPFTCPAYASTTSADSSIRGKYLSHSPSGTSKSSSPLHPAILDHSLLFPGTGAEVRRVLKRAMKSSLYGSKRAREGTEEDVQKMEDEEPFRVLVLGGSVSNCRGVDQNTACWHAHVLRWFQHVLPMEGDRDLVADTSSLLFPDPPAHEHSSPDGLRVQRLKKVVKRSLPQPPRAPDSPSRLSKRAASTKKKKKKKKKKTAKKGSTSRRRPSTRLINGSKSATGSAFFAYCFDEEMAIRGKDRDWGKGPDLIVVESGVNDVWPGGEAATRDFEKLLRRLQSLPSKPAVIALEAASLLLASTTSTLANAEYDHLPAAHFYDVPILSAKHALFGPIPGLLPASSTSHPLPIGDLFLPDRHHPNERGHELLADILLSYLEQQACLAQAEILDHTADRTFSSHDASVVAPQVDPELDIPRRADEEVRPLPPRSLFTPFPYDKKGGAVQDAPWELPLPRCIQIGNAKETVQPVRNEGWTQFAWARDKQYLVADKPGSSVTFRVEVGKGGTVLADWLQSRFYDLGDVSVHLDNDESSAISLAGYWDLGWSIGVPTEIFHGVAAGPHEVTFELLPPSRSSHPSKKTNFRLIGLITT
ncbi:hypothetical protein JCM10207_006622 [Rhodosporidiobolus poonsookiae]